jgi:signal recognition particle subunit SRP54
MFQVLGSRLQDVFGSLRREVRLTPEAVERTLREIRLALLEADVNFKVVKAFIDRVRDRATERAVLDSLTPSQQVVAIVRDELLRLFGESPAGLATTAERPQVVLLVGLQGSGKTTTTAKLGRWLTGQGRHPILVSTDVRRPAAIEQLAVLGRDAGLRVHDAGTDDPVRRATSAVSEARQLGFDVVLVDTAGRLHVDDELMQEIVAIRDAVAPSDTLFVADAMTGQDAVRSAGEFNHRLGVTGAVLTKLDGDARGGAALSVVSVVGVPVVFAATGERVGDLEPFRPERLVSRLLGMGDVLSLVERAEQAITGDDAASMATRMRRNELTLDDLKQQMRAVGRMGPLNQVLGMIPGLGSRIPEADVDASALTRMVAIIDSMTTQERRSPAVMNGSRRRRVARGSGTTVQDVNRLLRQFAEMRKMLKTVGGLSRRKGQRRRMALPTMR